LVIMPWRGVLDHLRPLPDNRLMAVGRLVWDMDGTLLDSGVVVPAAYVAAIRHLGGPAVSPEQVVAQYSVGPPERILAALLGRDVRATEAEAYYRELAEVDVRPYPGIAEVLSALRARGLPIAVFTGASSRAAAMLLKSANLDVDLLIGGDDVQRPKPAADGLLIAGARLGFATGGLAYIGDAPQDLRAARAAGAVGAAAAWGHQYDETEPADITLATPAEALNLLR
jgi:HAD superfamily hydrolase (TIGR01509 family)